VALNCIHDLPCGQALGHVDTPMIHRSYSCYIPKLRRRTARPWMNFCCEIITETWLAIFIIFNSFSELDLGFRMRNISHLENRF
jgi:hypothetical protein